MDIKKELSWFKKNVNYGGVKPVITVGEYNIKVIQNLYDGKINDLIIYLYKGDNFTNYINRYDISNNSQFDKCVADIEEIVK